MNITGIITEYNPFHNGHLYQIEQIKKQLKSDFIVIAMSGNFLQRGAPALLDKYTRAEMALHHGADLVMELPAYFATASAEAFAWGGVALFNTTKIVNNLCFGVESGCIKDYIPMVEILLNEPPAYKKALHVYLKSGLSFPLARMKALPGFEHLLGSPNNILALEYLKALKQTNAAITPLLLKRTGTNYHDTTIDGHFSSASAIRKHLLSGHDIDILKNTLPLEIYHILREYEKSSSFLAEDDFSLLLHARLLSETKQTLNEFVDMSPALANRILNYRNNFVSFRSFCEMCCSKDMTYTRISRVMTHILLGIKKEFRQPYQGLSLLPYIKVLGFRKNVGSLLSYLKKQTLAPIIMNPAAIQLPNPEAEKMLSIDILAADLYRCVLTEKTNRVLPNEYQRKISVI